MSGHSFLILLAATCVIGLAAPFVVTFVLDRRGSAPQTSLSICARWDHALRRATCLVDGDTGWEHGVKWRLSDVETPEINSPGCSNELQPGLAARDRLQRLMAAGYTINWLGRADRYNRQLVNVTLRDGRDAGRVLLGEGLARPFPNSQKAWCSG